MAVKPWKIVADVGGTNARFAAWDIEANCLQMVRHYSVADYRHFADALSQYLKDVSATKQWKLFPQDACFALACPIFGTKMRFTNSPWTVDREEIKDLLNDTPVDLINDFAAVGYAITRLESDDWLSINPGNASLDRPIVVLGPGTGLGVCTVVPGANGYQVLSGEGGHVDFAPIDETDAKIFESLNRQFGRVSVERVLSGNGIENIYRALAGGSKTGTDVKSAAEITTAALQEHDFLAIETLNVFCRNLGSVAGNLALTLGSKGGVYIAGGIVPRFIEFFLQSEFRDRFLAKGRFTEFLSDIPVRLVTKSDLGLSGAANKLNTLGK